MKIILTGCTGFVGSEVLSSCLDHPAITSVVALSRREFAHGSSHPKLRVVIVKDFASYDESVLSELDGADGCIWCIGTYTGDTVVEIDYPLAFANAIASRLRVQKKRFRYVHLGGGFTESDQEKQLRFYQTARRVRGLAETKMKDFGQRNDTEGIWETLIVKPMGILPKGSYAGWILSSIPLIGSEYFIRMEELTATMVDLVVNDSKDKTLTNRMIITKGRELLKGMP